MGGHFARRVRSRLPGTLAACCRYLPMTRRTDILVTVNKIKLTRKLEANLTDFVRVARAIGYQPKHAESTLKRFREQLASYREDLKRLTQEQSRLH
jgi:hypothetical protein